MPDSRSSIEKQNEISNASDRVVVVAARDALDEYLNCSAYICLPHRHIRLCVRMGFYRNNKIDRRIPKILEQIEAISPNEIETRTDLTDVERAKLRTLLKKVKPTRREEWSKQQFKVVFLTSPESADTFTLPQDIVNDQTSQSGRGTAFTQGQRYVSLSRLEKGPKTTSELV